MTTTHHQAHPPYSFRPAREEENNAGNAYFGNNFPSPPAPSGLVQSSPDYSDEEDGPNTFDCDLSELYKHQEQSYNAWRYGDEASLYSIAEDSREDRASEISGRLTPVTFASATAVTATSLATGGSVCHKIGGGGEAGDFGTEPMPVPRAKASADQTTKIEMQWTVDPVATSAAAERPAPIDPPSQVPNSRILGSKVSQNSNGPVTAEKERGDVEEQATLDESDEDPAPYGGCRDGSMCSRCSSTSSSFWCSRKGKWLIAGILLLLAIVVGVGAGVAASQQQPASNNKSAAEPQPEPPTTTGNPPDNSNGDNVLPPVDDTNKNTTKPEEPVDQPGDSNNGTDPVDPGDDNGENPFNPGNNTGTNPGNPGNNPGNSPGSILVESFVLTAIGGCANRNDLRDDTSVAYKVSRQLIKEVLAVSSDTDGDGLLDIPSSIGYDLVAERFGLMMLWESTNGNGWVNFDNWMTTGSLCDWYGMETCNRRLDGSCSVVSLVLGKHTIIVRSFFYVVLLYGSHHFYSFFSDANNLVGQLPNELCCLPCLSSLSLQFNQLTGQVPTCLDSMGVQLNLSGNLLG